MSRHGGKQLVLAAMAVVALGLSGCDEAMWWDYRDDPYIADMAKKGAPEVLRHVNSLDARERQMALRIIADSAGDARRRGSNVEADRLDDIIIRRYALEKDQTVRACIVRICAPLVGSASKRMPEFLRARIAAGEFPGYAAISLASLNARGALIDIEPLTRHPAHEVRYQAAVAMTVLGDQRGFEAVSRVWRGMHSQNWPERLEGVPLEEARNSLALRARRTFGRQVY